jgi:radical SAM superfamily enzyme YgiQ (UPF0313 family)
MSNLGFHSLFHRTASFQGVRAVRFFIERDKTLFSPEAYIPEKKRLFPPDGISLMGFDVILFTVSYELDYVNVIQMLELSSIPPVSEERDDRFSFIISGGIAPTANPLPLSVFSDLVFTGDMEEGLERILQTLFRQRFEKSDETRRKLSSVQGSLLAGWDVPKRNVSNTIPVPAHSVVLTPQTEFSNMLLVEIVRGCRGTCSFCMTRCATNPVRIVEEASILDCVRKGASHTRRVGLVAPLITDHPRLIEIVRSINRLGVRVAFSSMRPDRFSLKLAGLLKENSQTTVTFAPETGSFLLRRSIGKDIGDDVLLSAVHVAAQHGVRKVRYYIIFGLPDETPHDVLSVGVLARNTMKILGEYGGSLHLSINPFIPKKGTPLEKEQVCPPDYYKEMKKLLGNELGNDRAISMRFESTRLLYLQHHLSVGGRETGRLLYRCYIDGSMKPFDDLGPEVYLK